MKIILRILLRVNGRFTCVVFFPFFLSFFLNIKMKNASILGQIVVLIGSKVFHYKVYIHGLNTPYGTIKI